MKKKCSIEILSIISDALGGFAPAAEASPITITTYYLQPTSVHCKRGDYFT